MQVDVNTAWVLPPSPVTGEDHLGVRAVSEAIYTELVPCVTNVTDRVRSYAFYPWFTWKFGQQQPTAGYDEFVRLFRRAECLFTLVGARHELITKESPEMHGGGLVGRSKLLGPLRELDKRVFQLSDFAEPSLRTESAKSYFMAELGGFDQYYGGTLQTLDIMGGGRKGGIKVTPTRGVRLARAFDSEVPGNAFWNAILGDTVSAKLLDELVPFCPCHLERRTAEIDAILDVLLNRDRLAGAPDMRDALRLVCDFLVAQKHPVDDRDRLIWQFRESAYGGLLPTGAWNDTALSKWAAYHRHELLSVTLQSLFCGVFRAVEKANDAGQLPALQSSHQVARWFMERCGAELSGLELARPARDFFADAATRLPPRGDIQDEAHELRQAERLIAEKEIGPAISRAVTLLASLSARLADEPPYPGFSREDSYFKDYPLNLRSLRSLSLGTWQSLTVKDWITWLVTHWSVGHHLRVAFRKLHSQGIDTFRIRPSELGLLPVQNIEVVYGNPRLEQTLRALRDLGLIDAEHRLTAAGQVLRGELHG